MTNPSLLLGGKEAAAVFQRTAMSVFGGQSSMMQRKKPITGTSVKTILQTRWKWAKYATTTNITTASSAVSLKRCFSSALPEPRYAPSSRRQDHEQEEETFAADHNPNGGQNRSRLRELRRKLRQDGPLSLSSPVIKESSSSSPSSSLRLPDQTKTTTDAYTREDWLALVDLLPEPAQDETVLTDTFQRRHSYLRLSLAERCNLRCTYCMPEDGVSLQPASHLLQTDELLHLAQFFRSYGVDKFRLTGGEPTLRADLVNVVEGLHALAPRQIGMTTNGVALAKKLPALVEHGLDSVNVSLDTLVPEKFQALTRRPATYLDKVYESLEACYQHMHPSQIKINCVLMRGVNTQEVADFINLGIQHFPGIAVRFIEYMPFTDNGWQLDKLVPYKEVLHDLEAHPQQDWQISKSPQKDPHDTTQWYKAFTSDDRYVNLGFITSMSRPFCAGCNRLRLSADGQLKVCLFGSTIHPHPAHLPSLWSLRDALRVGQLDDTQLSRLVHAALQTKAFALGGHDSPQTIHEHARENSPMTLIGG